MDHGWMYTKCNSVAFVQDLELFVNAVSAYMEHNVEALGFINCLCRDCKNLKQWDSMELIRVHLLWRGFMPNYMVWAKHGEEGENPPDKQASAVIWNRNRNTNVGEIGT
jgi:hypothetical protein